MIVFVWTEIKICVYHRLRLQSSSGGRSLSGCKIALRMRIYKERTKSESKQTNAKKGDNKFRISKLLMLITLLSAPSAVEWRASQSVVFGARPFTLFDLPVKNGKSRGSSSLACGPFT